MYIQPILPTSGVVKELTPKICSFNNNGNYGLVNDKGELVASPIYDSITLYTYDILRVVKDNKWGLIDDQGNIVLDIKYEVLKHNVTTLTYKDNTYKFSTPITHQFTNNSYLY